MSKDFEPQPLKLSRRTTVVMVGLALLKIWLTRALTLWVVGDSDEKTFLLQAQGLLSGHWLGAYTPVTLVKMPFYSMFLTATFLLGIPVLLAQQLLYVVACALLLFAVRPALASWRPVQFVMLYAVLIFNPMSCLGSERLLRNHFYASLGVFLVAGVAGVVARVDKHWRSAWKWQVLFTLALTGQWLSREESSWVAPFLMIYTFVLVWMMWRTGRLRWRRLIPFVVVPYCVVMLAVLTIATFNQRIYGVFVTNEQQSKETNDAVGAIHRVNPRSDRNHYDVVTQETRQRIYLVSPAFAELRNSLEGELAKKWATPSCEIDEVCSNNDVGWGWFTWELREAAMVAGHQGNATEAARFYEKLATEINAGCADGRLSCQPSRSSTMPAWENKYTWEVVERFWSTLKYVTSFADFSLGPNPDEGSPELLAQYGELSLEPVSLSAPELLVSGWALSTKSPVELSVRDANGAPVEYAVRLEPRPDVAAFAKKIGYEQPVKLDTGFRLRTWCTKGCYLYVRGGINPDVWQKAFPLDGSTGSNLRPAAASQGQNKDPYLAAMLNGDAMVYVDSVSPAGASSTHLQPRLNSLKLSILAAIGLIYQRLTPLFFVLACIVFAIAWLQSVRRQAISAWIIIVTLILLLLLNRLAFMSVVDVVAIREISHLAEYEQYAYPLILLYSGLLLLNLPYAFRADNVK